MRALILIVEDQPLHAKLFRDIVEANGYRTMVVRTGAEAAEAAIAARPALMLLDILLPDMDGRELIASMGADERTRTTPILAVSARPDREMIDTCLLAGANGFMAKPLRMAQLIDEVARLT